MRTLFIAAFALSDVVDELEDFDCSDIMAGVFRKCTGGLGVDAIGLFASCDFVGSGLALSVEVELPFTHSDGIDLVLAASSVAPVLEDTILTAVVSSPPSAAMILSAQFSSFCDVCSFEFVGPSSASSVTTSDSLPRVWPIEGVMSMAAPLVSGI